MKDHVATASHEFRGSLTWVEHGDAPFWAGVSLYRRADGGGTYELELDGEQLTVTLGYKKEGISPRPGDSVDEILAPQIYWQTPEGLKFGGILKPIFEPSEYRKLEPEKSFHDREQISVPSDLGEATSFQIVAGKYREPGYYARTLPRVLAALASEIGVGWNPEYLKGEPHEYSTITTLARTLRIDRPSATKLTRDDGILSRIFRLVGRQEGTRSVYTADNTEIMGYYHTVELDENGASELIPGRVPGLVLKVYYPKHVRKEGKKDDPLYYPRAEIIFKKSLNSNGRPFHDRGSLADTLEELLINVLNWGGIPIEASTPPFIADPFADVEPSDRPLRLFDDPTPEIKREQENALLKRLADLSSRDADRVAELVADGGSAHYDDAAESLDVSTSTLYRFLTRCEGLLESDNGLVKFISERQRQQAAKILKPLHETVDVKARALAELVGTNARLLEQKGSAFQEWLTTYAVDVEADDEGGLRRLKVGAMLSRLRSTADPHVADVVDEGLRAWDEAGLDPREFLNALVAYPGPDGNTRITRARNALA